YEPQSGQLLFAPGDAPKTVSIPVVGDDVEEGTEVVYLKITGVFDGTLTDGIGEGLIIDDDGPPPVCAGGTTISRPRLVLKHLGGTVGDETFTFSGRVMFGAGQPAGMTPLDAVAHGAQIIVEDVGAGGAPIFELSHRTTPVPPGGLGSPCQPSRIDGWQA